MIDTFVTFHVLPGRTADFKRLHQELLARISAQPGCATIRVHRSATNPLEFMVHGTWTTKEAWERAHQTTPEFKPLFGRLPIERHSLTRHSFFETAYEFSGAAIDARGAAL
jgi:quinol monooxygenase YgiN